MTRDPTSLIWSTACDPINARWCRCGRARSRARRAGQPRRLGRRSQTIDDLRKSRIRVSLFVDPEDAAVRWAADLGADRIELYTEPFARAFERGDDEARRAFQTYANAAGLAHALGLGVNRPRPGS